MGISFPINFFHAKKIYMMTTIFLFPYTIFITIKDIIMLLLTFFLRKQNFQHALGFPR